MNLGQSVSAATHVLVGALLLFFAAASAPALSATNPAHKGAGPGDPGKGNLVVGQARESVPRLQSMRGNTDIVVIDDINFVPNPDFTGGSILWVDGSTCDCDTAPFNLNVYGSPTTVQFFWPNNANQSEGGVTLDGGSTYAVLAPGDTIGPASSFLVTTASAATAPWSSPGNVDGYLGFRFLDEGITKYGYAHITTGANGRPFTILSVVYNNAGDPITIGAIYNVGGTVDGLAGSGLVLQNNGGDDLPITADGPFTFASLVADGDSYEVTVLSQPENPSQTCSVTNGTGTISGADVDDVEVICVTDTFTVGGTVSGLSGTGLVLQNNGGDDLPIAADGAFVFSLAVADGGAYDVTVLSQPGSPSQTCSVTNGTGTVSGADVDDVEVICVTDTFTVGGTVSGLTGSGLVLQNNGGDDLAIAADGAFVFATALDDLSSYQVTVLTQPSQPDQVCDVSNGAGTISGANVDDVQVDCTTPEVAPPIAVPALGPFGLIVLALLLAGMAGRQSAWQSRRSIAETR